MILDHLLRVRDAAVLVNERICEFFAPHSLSRLPIRVHCSRAVANSYGMRHLFYLHFRLCSSAPNASMICNAKSVMIQSNWGPDYAVNAAGKECTISMCVCMRGSSPRHLNISTPPTAIIAAALTHTNFKHRKMVLQRLRLRADTPLFPSTSVPTARLACFNAAVGALHHVWVHLSRRKPG
jgi:hypothetical protein